MSKYRELEFNDGQSHPNISCDFGYNVNTGTLDVSVTNIINMQDETCFMELSREQTQQLITMLSTGLAEAIEKIDK